MSRFEELAKNQNLELYNGAEFQEMLGEIALHFTMGAFGVTHVLGACGAFYQAGYERGKRENIMQAFIAAEPEEKA